MRRKKDKCSCCLLPATTGRHVYLGEVVRPAPKTGRHSVSRYLPTCEMHAKVPARAFRILAGLKRLRLAEPVLEMTN